MDLAHTSCSPVTKKVADQVASTAATKKDRPSWGSQYSGGDSHPPAPQGRITVSKNPIPTRCKRIILRDAFCTMRPGSLTLFYPMLDPPHVIFCFISGPSGSSLTFEEFGLSSLLSVEGRERIFHANRQKERMQRSKCLFVLFLRCGAFEFQNVDPRPPPEGRRRLTTTTQKTPLPAKARQTGHRAFIALVIRRWL